VEFRTEIAEISVRGTQRRQKVKFAYSRQLSLARVSRSLVLKLDHQKEDFKNSDRSRTAVPIEEVTQACHRLVFFTGIVRLLNER